MVFITNVFFVPISLKFNAYRGVVKKTHGVKVISKRANQINRVAIHIGSGAMCHEGVFFFTPLYPTQYFTMYVIYTIIWSKVSLIVYY